MIYTPYTLMALKEQDQYEDAVDWHREVDKHAAAWKVLEKAVNEVIEWLDECYRDDPSDWIALKYANILRMGMGLPPVEYDDGG